MAHQHGKRTRAKAPDVYKLLPVLPADKVPLDPDEIAANARKPRINLPVPDVSEVPSFANIYKPGFKIPDAYIRFNRKRMMTESCEYDLTREDEQWLRKHPQYGDSAPDSTRLALDLFEKMINTFEKAAASSPSRRPDLSPDQAERIVANELHLQFSANNPTVKDILEYWKKKRERLKKPLLRRFWPPPAANNQDPHAVFRARDTGGMKLRRQRGRSEQESWRKLAQLLKDLKSARTIMELVLERERHKRELAAILEDRFEQRMHELTDTTGIARTPTTLSRREDLRATAREAAKARSTIAEAATVDYAGRLPTKDELKRRQKLAQQRHQARLDHRGSKDEPPFHSGPWRLPHRLELDHPPGAEQPDPYQEAAGLGEDAAVPALHQGAAGGRAQTSAALDPLHAAGDRRLPGDSVAASVRHGLAIRRVREFGSRRGVGGTGAGEAEADLLGLAMAHGLAVGFPYDSNELMRMQIGRQLRPISDPGLKRVMQERTALAKSTIGMLQGGSAWEERAGMALGIGAIGPHGEGWEALGGRPQALPPPLEEVESAVQALRRESGRRRGAEAAGKPEAEGAPAAKRSRMEGGVTAAQGAAAAGADADDDDDEAQDATMEAGSRRGRHGKKKAAAAAAAAAAGATEEGQEQEAESEEDAEQSDATLHRRLRWLRQSRPRRAQYLARPRTGRGGRLLIDRLPIPKALAAKYAAATADLQQRRRQQRDRRKELARGPAATLMTAARSVGVRPFETPLVAEAIASRQAPLGLSWGHWRSDAHGVLHAAFSSARSGGAAHSSRAALWERCSAPSAERTIVTNLLADGAFVRVGGARPAWDQPPGETSTAFPSAERAGIASSISKWAASVSAGRRRGQGSDLPASASTSHTGLAGQKLGGPQPLVRRVEGDTMDKLYQEPTSDDEGMLQSARAALDQLPVRQNRSLYAAYNEIRSARSSRDVIEATPTTLAVDRVLLAADSDASDGEDPLADTPAGTRRAAAAAYKWRGGRGLMVRGVAGGADKGGVVGSGSGRAGRSHLPASHRRHVATWRAALSERAAAEQL